MILVVRFLWQMAGFLSDFVKGTFNKVVGAATFPYSIGTDILIINNSLIANVRSGGTCRRKRISITPSYQKGGQLPSQFIRFRTQEWSRRPLRPEYVSQDESAETSEYVIPG
jgi:hypothetical protein